MQAIAKKKNLKDYIDHKVYRLGRCKDIDYINDQEVKLITKVHEKKKDAIVKTRAKIEDLIIDNKDDSFIKTLDRSLTMGLSAKKKQ